jgi:hypothetical protein
MSFKSIIAGIGTFISKLVGIFKISTAAGISIANDIKNAVDSPLADLVVNLTPTNLDNQALAQLRIWIPVLLKDLGLVHDITGGLERAVSDAGATIAQMSIQSAKAGTLNTIAAAINQKVAELHGQVIPIEMALSITPTAYTQPELLK